MSDWLLMGFLTTTQDFQDVGSYIRGTVFRFTALNHNPADKRLKPHCFAKMSYLGGGGVMDTRWYRFYPGSRPVILEIPLPEEFYRSGFVSRLLQVKQAPLRYGGEGLPWSLQVDRYDPV